MTQFPSLTILIICWSIASSWSLEKNYCDGSQDQVNLSALDDAIWDHRETSPIRNASNPSGRSANVTTQVFFSFCRLLGNHPHEESAAGCESANVCVVRTFADQTRMVDTYTTDNLMSQLHGIHQMHFSSNESCESGVVQKRVHVHFSCDRRGGLGRPIKLLTQPCLMSFNWPTIVACGSANKHPILAKCYVYDHNDELRDLSRLIAADGHVVSSPAEDGVNSHAQYFINICSEVNQSCQTTKSSSSGTSVCVKSPTRRVEHLGDVRKARLTYDEKSDEVIVKYLSTSGRACPSGAFVTLIRLRCPPSRAEFSYYGLESRKPFIVERTDCEIVIEWQTDYACPTHVYEGSLTSKNCGIQVDDSFLDLKPLHRNDSYLISNVSAGNETLDVALNICGGVTSRRLQFCPHSDWTSDAVCMRSSNNSTAVLGTLIDAKLIYADGQVLLLYPTRQPSSCSGQPQTDITFLCDPSVQNGEPAFISYSECVLSIQWKTSRVCLPHHLQPPPCVVQAEEGLLYDLSPLRRRSNESMWPVSLSSFRPHSLSGHKIGEKDKIFLNVCGGIPKTRMPGSGNLDKSSVYLYDGAKSVGIPLGQFIQPPGLHRVTKRLMLVYNATDDSVLGAKQLVTTTILFTCAPGNIESTPKLTNVSIRSSGYETWTEYSIEWKTGAACPLVKSSGTDCVVIDRNLGLKFDLNPLHEELHDIEMKQGNFKYYMNICGRLKSDFCKEENVGICRVGSDGRARSLGQFTRNVTYWNGVLTLRYGNELSLGNAPADTHYSDISLLCDEEDSRQPEMISEQNNAYTFRMYTKHACPDMENVVPCVWENGTHTVDLSPLANSTDNHFDVLYDKSTRTSVIYYFSFCRPLTRLLHEESNCREGSAACKVTMRDGKVNSTLSLGIPRDPPGLFFGQDHLSLIYTNGDECPSNGSARRSFVIKFFCDQSEGDGLTRDIREISNGCGDEIKFHTALVCDVFPASSLPVPRNSTPPDPVAEATSSDDSTIVLLIVVAIAFLAASFALLTIVTRADVRSRVVSRLRSLVCRDLIPPNPIHYSQLQSSGRDPLAFISPGSSSQSPYNSTTMSLNDASRNTQTRLTRTHDGRDSSEDTIQLI